MTDFTNTRKIMVNCQIRPSGVTKYLILQAFLLIKRECYFPPEKHSLSYVGKHINVTPQRIVLDPRIFAKMLDALDIRHNEIILDIGCAMGYSTAILAYLAKNVVGIDDDPTLTKLAQSRLSNNVQILCAPLVSGASQHAPYDIIIFQGGVEYIPAALLDQLNTGGRIGAIFSHKIYGVFKIGYKGSNGQVSWRNAFDAQAPILLGFKKPQTFNFV